MIESAMALGVFGLFGFCLAVAAFNRLKRIEDRLSQLESETNSRTRHPTSTHALGNQL